MVVLRPTAIVVGLTISVLCGCKRAQPVEEIRVSSTEPASSAALAIDPEADWPWWRGVRGDGHSRNTGLPTEWSSSQNILWSTRVAGRGHSSPCIVGEKLFLTTADEESERQSLLCYDRLSGQQQWSTTVHEGRFMAMHRKNSHASATPACDGRAVFTVFLNRGGLWATAVDLDGHVLWQTEAGAFGAEHGYGSSPTIYKSLLIVLGDNLTGSFIAALDRATGRIVWRTARSTSGKHGSYATPVVATIAGREQLLVTGTGSTTSYDPASGEMLWTCEGPAEVTANTVAWGEDLVFASGGYPEKQILAIRADGAGDVTDSHLAWSAKRGTAYVPSPIFHEGKLFLISDDGIATCLEAATGRPLHKARIGGNFSASPVLADGRLYVTDESGTTVVIRADESLEILARNDLGGGGMASVVVVDSKIYVRTQDQLVCVGLAASPPRILSIP